MDAGCDSVQGGEAREGASLVWVEKTAGPHEEREAGGGDRFHFFRNGFLENNDRKGSRRIVVGFTGFIKDNPAGIVEVAGVVAVLE